MLRIPADVNELAADPAVCARPRGRAGADQQQTNDLVQAVDESATNSIVHGYRGAEGQVEIEIDVLETTSFSCACETRLQPFDPTALPDPDVTLPLRSRPFHGLGVFLHAATDRRR